MVKIYGTKAAALKIFSQKKGAHTQARAQGMPLPHPEQ
jgi:hypothetical protein